MPVVSTTAYGTVEDILLDARALVNDMAVEQGDVLTDTAPFAIQFVNIAYRSIQAYLAQWGVETYTALTWLLNIAPNTTGDPESRVLLSDSGLQVITPSGAGESSYADPLLPDDLVAPLRIRERWNGSTQAAIPMRRPNDGLVALPIGGNVGTYLRFWDWLDDTLWFYGATQAIDIELKYEKSLPILSAVTDTVPIRGVNNAAAYRVAQDFTAGRGGAASPGFGVRGQAELDYLVNRTVRARQRVSCRRRPFRGGSGGRRGNATLGGGS